VGILAFLGWRSLMYDLAALGIAAGCFALILLLRWVLERV
jgi:hypothetical protein